MESLKCFCEIVKIELYFKNLFIYSIEWYLIYIHKSSEFFNKTWILKGR